MKTSFFIFVGMLFLKLPPSVASEVLIEIRDIRPEQIMRKDFVLDRETEVEIEAVIGLSRYDEEFLSGSWILNAENRTLVWRCMADAEENSSKRDDKVRCEQKLTISKGRYEIYYAIDPSPSQGVRGVSEALDFVFNGFKKKNYSPQWGVTLRIPRDGHTIEPNDGDGAIVRLIKTYDNEYKSKGFSISVPMKVRIYAVGEGSFREREMNDYGWIMEAHSRNKIWEMNPRKTQHAGGADKNLMADETIELPAGDYVVHFVTDDSHSFERWNTFPPYDPYHWGITIWAIALQANDALVKPYLLPELKPLVEMNYVRNNALEFEGFSLKRDCQLHVRAVGEYSESENDFVDYGWITDTRTRKVVWRMDFNNTQHAGGGKKNRIFDDIISLPAGSYLIYYISDDSHAYRDWNTSPPYDPGAWGITVLPPDEKYDPGQFEVYEEQSDKNILAQIVKVRGDEDLTASFSLTETSAVRVYAIGEGERDEMYDYGWVADTRGRILWEMDYENSQPAGGAKKNRMVNDVIDLPSGSYLVHYKTDGSHHYHDWNSTPPDDPTHWGITIIMQQK